MLRKKSGRRKQSRAAGKKRKPAASKPIKKRIGSTPYSPDYSKLMEEVIGTISDQILNLEIKMAVQQFLINETIDEWQRKDWLSEQEVKSLYERTYQYWKNDMKSQGTPFAELDLSRRPALETYQSNLQQSSKTIPSSQGSPAPVTMNPQREEDAELIKQMKDEMKAMKREFLKQKLEDMRRNFK
ncbi:hypothetical protein ACFPYJ_26040 [Paenibacillus solisilvae]|uniref:Uncharacterized protein n=1 Tax=Paenibacillus solisilvae TaxID=2486751 RepID=A0ABW0W5K3_9BACL